MGSTPGYRQAGERSCRRSAVVVAAGERQPGQVICGHDLNHSSRTNRAAGASLRLRDLGKRRSVLERYPDCLGSTSAGTLDLASARGPAVAVEQSGGELLTGSPHRRPHGVRARRLSVTPVAARRAGYSRCPAGADAPTRADSAWGTIFHNNASLYFCSSTGNEWMTSPGSARNDTPSENTREY